jgi:hypothetical protein
MAEAPDGRVLRTPETKLATVARYLSATPSAPPGTWKRIRIVALRYGLRCSSTIRAEWLKKLSSYGGRPCDAMTRYASLTHRSFLFTGGVTFCGRRAVKFYPDEAHAAQLASEIGLRLVEGEPMQFRTVTAAARRRACAWCSSIEQQALGAPGASPGG